MLPPMPQLPSGSVQPLLASKPEGQQRVEGLRPRTCPCRGRRRPAVASGGRRGSRRRRRAGPRRAAGSGHLVCPCRGSWFEGFPSPRAQGPRDPGCRRRSWAGAPRWWRPVRPRRPMAAPGRRADLPVRRRARRRARGLQRSRRRGAPRRLTRLRSARGCWRSATLDVDAVLLEPGPEPRQGVQRCDRSASGVARRSFIRRFGVTNAASSLRTGT